MIFASLAWRPLTCLLAALGPSRVSRQAIASGRRGRTFSWQACALHVTPAGIKASSRFAYFDWLNSCSSTVLYCDTRALVFLICKYMRRYFADDQNKAARACPRRNSRTECLRLPKNFKCLFGKQRLIFRPPVAQLKFPPAARSHAKLHLHAPATRIIDLSSACVGKLRIKPPSRSQ